MSVLEGKLVRTVHGTRGRVMALAIAKYEEVEDGDVVREIGFIALLQTDDGKLTSVKLEGAEVIPQREPSYERPAPTSLPGPGEVRR